MFADLQVSIVLGLLVLVIILLIADKWKPSIVFGGGALVLILAEIVTPKELLINFANESVITIFLLIIITATLNDHFALVDLLDRIFAKTKSIKGFIFRMGASVGVVSSIMNNTPIVAMMIPYVYQWGKRNKIAPSKLLIPLSFATIMGGMMTMIGTSTNLVLNGFIQAKGGVALGFLDYLIPGVCVTIVGLTFLVFFSNRLLPTHKDLQDELQENIKEYLVETKVLSGTSIIGKTIGEAGLRNLDGIFLVEILRNGKVMSPVDPDEVIQTGDHLFFAGQTEKVMDLVERNNGLELPKQSEYNLGAGLNFVETVIPNNSPLIGKTLKQALFRDYYDAAVVAIHRNGEKIRGRLGDIVLDKGDLLLLTAGKGFLERRLYGKDLYLVSVLKTINKVEPKKARWFWMLFLFVLALSIAGVISLFVMLLLILAMSAFFKFTNYEHIKRNTSLDLLVILGCAITFSNALITTGGSDLIGQAFTALIGSVSPISVIIGVYLLTVLLTSFITNAAAVAIVFPVAWSLIETMHLPSAAVFLSIAFGASCCFLTPVGYQTNLMVYGPGNYRFQDFVKIGVPTAIIYSVVALSVIILRYL